MPDRICKAPVEYAGVARKPGERIHVEDVHVEMMVGAGFIEREESDIVPGYVRADLASAWPGASTYNTRALTATRGRRAQRPAA